VAARSTRRVALLDVNVLIAMAWPNHVHHQPARAWFERHHRAGWATTPITQTGFVRVSSNRAAIAVATTPPLAISLLTSMCSLPGHQFWPDDVSGVCGDTGDPELVRTHRNVTDAHLLALAERLDGSLVTFDAGIARLLGDRSESFLEILKATA
jgi:toxin-antitoxin system PIN domain toxin